MRARPVSRSTRIPSSGSDAAFTGDSRLRAIVLDMISTNSLAAFTQEISRRPALTEPVRGVAPSQPANAGAAGVPSLDPQRALDAVPPQPARPVPRGSLLDLRV
jgi:hypothetical protein